MRISPMSVVKKRFRTALPKEPEPPVIIRVLELKMDGVDSLVISFIILCYPLIFRCSTVNVVPMSLSESRLDEAQKINTRL